MKSVVTPLLWVWGLLALVACGSDSEPLTSVEDEPLAPSTVLDLDKVKSQPGSFEWFDFRPNVKKLILAGTAETEHIAVLWYTVEDGGVGLHYHSKTEAVYVIDGTQTDAKGDYATGSVYFNPPGSGHEITDSSGFFLLSYAAPPDFARTDSIQEYEPIRIDTTAKDLTLTHAFEQQARGVAVYGVPLDEGGGLTAELIELSSSSSYDYVGNYVLVLKGSCAVDGVPLGERTLVVAKELEPEPYRLSRNEGSVCLVMGVSF